MSGWVCGWVGKWVGGVGGWMDGWVRVWVNGWVGWWVGGLVGCGGGGVWLGRWNNTENHHSVGGSRLSRLVPVELILTTSTSTSNSICKQVKHATHSQPTCRQACSLTLHRHLEAMANYACKQEEANDNCTAQAQAKRDQLYQASLPATAGQSLRCPATHTHTHTHTHTTRSASC